MRSSNHITPSRLAGRNLPPVLLAIEQDFVTGRLSRQDRDRAEARVRDDPKLRKLLG